MSKNRYDILDAEPCKETVWLDPAGDTKDGRYTALNFSHLFKGMDIEWKYQLNTRYNLQIPAAETKEREAMVL